MALLLSGKASDSDITAKNNPIFLEAVLWIKRTNAPAPWECLPEYSGHWHNVLHSLSKNRAPYLNCYPQIMI